MARGTLVDNALIYSAWIRIHHGVSGHAGGCIFVYFTDLRCVALMYG
jgi:hypothetical protein